MQSILHYKNRSHCPLYVFRFFQHIKTPHLSDRILSDKWGAVHSPIPEQQLHATGVHVEMASSCIVLHVHVLLKSCCGLYRSIYDFGFYLPRTPALNFPKKTNNPNPSPIGNKFGLFLFGPSGENRTHGLLNPIQARYQNCATPGYRPPLPYRSVATRDIIRRLGAFVNHFLQFFRVFLQKVRFLRTGALFIVVLPAAVPCPFPAGA